MSNISNVVLTFWVDNNWVHYIFKNIFPDCFNLRNHIKRAEKSKATDQGKFASAGENIFDFFLCVFFYRNNMILLVFCDWKILYLESESGTYFILFSMNFCNILPVRYYKYSELFFSLSPLGFHSISNIHTSFDQV